jgi:hypothetical protein
MSLYIDYGDKHGSCVEFSPPGGPPGAPVGIGEISHMGIGPVTILHASPPFPRRLSKTSVTIVRLRNVSHATPAVEDVLQ